MSESRKDHVFDGVAVALATLFDEDGGVAIEATVEHAQRVVDVGLSGVVVAGSTGEAPALDRGERVRLIGAVRDGLAEDVPVVAGTGAAWKAGAVELTIDAREAGADAVLALSALRAVDHVAYYGAVVAAAGDLPVLAYHFPSMSPNGIPVSELTDLDEVGVAGVKDSSGDADRLLRTVDVYDGQVFIGSSPLVLQAGAVGCAGAILAAANLDPARCIAAFNGDGDAQRELIGAHRQAAADFPDGLKQAMADRFGTSPVTRMG